MSLFGWWKPKCPVGLREKAWVEMRLQWLGEQFGMERLAKCRFITPTEEYFPDDFDETPEAARKLLDRVAPLVGFAPSLFQIRILPKEACGEAVAFEPGVIVLAEAQLTDPFLLAAILARQLAVYRLHQQRLLEDEPDWLWTADLTATLLGMGVFMANATVIETHHHAGRGSRTAVNRLGYLPSRMTGYALAILALLNDEPKPAWAEFLRHDAADAFRQGMDYIQRTEDSLLLPDKLRNYDHNPSIRKLAERLEEGSGSEVVLALWELARRGEAAGESAAAVACRLTDRRPAIRAEAARTLAELGAAAQPAMPQIIESLEDGEIEVRAAAAYAAGRLHIEPEQVVSMLIDRLDDRETIDTVAWALAQFGAAARPALPRLVAVLKGQIGCCEGAIDYLVYAVRAISPNPEAELQQLIESCDADLQRQVDHLLPEPGPIPTPPGGRGWWLWADGPS